MVGLLSVVMTLETMKLAASGWVRDVPFCGDFRGGPGRPSRHRAETGSVPSGGPTRTPVRGAQP